MKPPTKVVPLAVLGLVTSLPAQVVVGFVETGNLPRNDDHFSGAVELGFTINFGGTNYAQTYVSNNGYITFGSGSGVYWPSPIDASYVSSGAPGLPIIAPFFADVDTRDPLSGIVNWGTATVDNRPAFVVNWPNVGEYGAQTFSPNTFSLILVSRTDLGAGNFDVFFKYGSITWDHGNTVAGFHNGSTTTPLFYQVPGSGLAGSFLDSGANSLFNSTNTGATGSILLQGRNGSFAAVAPITVIPEPSTVALLGLGLGVVALCAYRRRAA